MPMNAVEEKIYEEKVRMLQGDIDIDVWAKESFSDENFRLVFLKALEQWLPTQLKLTSTMTEQAILKDNKISKLALYTVLEALKSKPSVRVVAKPRGKATLTNSTYSTGELSEFFGVSVTTINNWISEGRFEGVKRDVPHQRIFITKDTIFSAPTGLSYPVRNVIEAYKKDQAEWNDSLENYTISEKQQVENYNNYFKEKYGGTFEKIFGNKNWKDLTSEEETDASMWSFFLERISDEFRD